VFIISPLLGSLVVNLSIVGLFFLDLSDDLYEIRKRNKNIISKIPKIRDAHAPISLMVSFFGGGNGEKLDGSIYHFLYFMYLLEFKIKKIAANKKRSKNRPDGSPVSIV